MKREQIAVGGLAQALARAREDYPMYEEFYGFSEKPFSLTPDPKYLYRSESHANAFDLLQYAIRRREGFVVITGDIGTGKTTLCRAILDQLDRRTFTALVLNPFISDEDLLRLILQDFGVVSREEVRSGRLAGVTKQELINTLNDFLLSLQPIGGSALLIVDEAQNLPLQVLEQIRLLSNLETDKEKLLQIVLVGQLNLNEILRSAELRQLDQRISIRYQLRPLTVDETAAYVLHRLTIAGGGSAVTFTAKALQRVHRFTGGIPRLINLLCDRALLAGYSARMNRILPDAVDRAAHTLDLERPNTLLPDWLRRRTAALALAGIAGGIGAAALIYGAALLQASSDFSMPVVSPPQVSRPHQ
jgi:general secretion pathway protein A